MFKYSLEQILQEYEPVIGLEVHIELNTPTKMFCKCPADWFGKAPNTQVCPICLGMPGALPVPNRTALEYTIKIASALNCSINTFQQFDRKHYFYPDLPKGYQITQFYHPVGESGEVLVFDGKDFKPVRIRRIHLEEDTGKLIHKGNKSLVDFNRSGVPLVEIVTEPDFVSAEQVKNYLKLLQALVRYLGVSNADMEKGNMRLEPNISLRKRGTQGLPDYKVEVKNINSFNFVVRAIEYEIIRQGNILLKGQTPPQETRGYLPDKGKTVSQRIKEQAQDYRYLPDPDIPPVQFTHAEIESFSVSDTPFIWFERLQQAGLDSKSIWFLIDNNLVQLFFEVVELLKRGEGNQTVEKIQRLGTKLTPAKLGRFFMNHFQKYNFRTPTDVLEAIINVYAKPTLDKETIRALAKEVLEANPKAVADYKAGNQGALQFLLGQFMRKIRQKIDMQPVVTVFKELLEED